ncbi:jg26820 [Pararge aegeria aegeria]|uniref:Jg26820 protein n=1 Tax=Pararge aegeria aegeria TaxID=348720 RepID=A0A8S4SK44_9NEOP|nr:jg26820 [Pararge aegeria aegeria]
MSRKRSRVRTEEEMSSILESGGGEGPNGSDTSFESTSRTSITDAGPMEWIIYVVLNQYYKEVKSCPTGGILFILRTQHTCLGCFG